jgi:hypothetical protein
MQILAEQYSRVARMDIRKGDAFSMMTRNPKAVCSASLFVVSEGCHRSFVVSVLDYARPFFGP